MSDINQQLVLPNIPEEIKALRLSVSKVKCFSQCKKMYHFQYVIKIPRREFEFHHLGKAIHLVLELFHSDCISGSIQPLNKIMANAFQTAMKEFGSLLSPSSKKEVFNMADQYLKRITGNKAEIKSVIAVEKNFAVNITDKVILNGMIDKVQMDPDGVLHIQDYKTTKNKKYLKNDWLQLLTYAYIMYLEYPALTRVRGSYVLLRHNYEYFTKEFSLDEILEVKNQFETYANQINDEKEYTASPTRLCEWCSALDQCDDGKGFLNMGTGQTTW